MNIRARDLIQILNEQKDGASEKKLLFIENALESLREAPDSMVDGFQVVLKALKEMD